LAASVSFAGTLQGTVVNRTTGRTVPNVDVDLPSPTQGMALLGSVKSDAQGHFTANNDAIGTPVLVVSATVTVSLFDREPIVKGKGIAFLAVFDVVFLTVLWLFGEYLLEE